MKKLLLLSLLAVSQSFAMQGQQKMAGGSPAEQGLFPFLASLKYSDDRDHFCGAGILTKRWLLSAAHCLIRVNPSDFYVYVGSAYLDRYGQNYIVEEKILHPNYINSVPFPNDIAMIKVVRDMELNENIKTIYLPYNIRIQPGDLVTVAGWGTVSTSYPETDFPNQLQYQVREIISNDDCSALISYRISERQICHSGNHGHGVCPGDSGSPLIYVNKNRTYVVGVVSWGRPCGRGYPDVYAKVSSYVPWILEKLT